MAKFIKGAYKKASEHAGVQKAMDEQTVYKPGAEGKKARMMMAGSARNWPAPRVYEPRAKIRGYDGAK